MKAILISAFCLVAMTGCITISQPIGENGRFGYITMSYRPAIDWSKGPTFLPDK